MAIEGATPRKPPVVSDPHDVPIVFVDWILVGGVYENVLHLTLGTIDYSARPSADDAGRVTVAAQMRMSREFAMRLHDALGDMIRDSARGTPGGSFN